MEILWKIHGNFWIYYMIHFNTNGEDNNDNEDKEDEEQEEEDDVNDDDDDDDLVN